MTKFPTLSCTLTSEIPTLFYTWARLFKRWIALSTGQIIIQRISIWETNCVTYWIEIYPAVSAIHLLNNWGLKPEKAFFRAELPRIGHKTVCPNRRRWNFTEEPARV